MTVDSNEFARYLLLSWVQVRPLLKLQGSVPVTIELSFDLSLSQTQVKLVEAGLCLPENNVLSWEELEEIDSNENACYLIEEGYVTKIHRFSEDLNRVYTLMPTEAAPTMLISGFPMHRIKGNNPHLDTISKVKTIAPTTGTVLDTTMGLGYTAIEMAKRADEVITIELDPAVLEICRFNPWSRNLFSDPRIKIRIGDCYEVIDEFDDNTFSRILHDPPTFSLAGDLYSSDFYRKLYRVLKQRGRLFHYVGDPKSKSGRGTTRGVKRRLMDAGFQRVMPRERAFGLLAYK